MQPGHVTAEGRLGLLELSSGRHAECVLTSLLCTRVDGGDVPEFLCFQKSEFFFPTYPFREILCVYKQTQLFSLLCLNDSSVYTILGRTSFPWLCWHCSNWCLVECCHGEIWGQREHFSLISDPLFPPPPKSLLQLFRNFTKPCLSIGRTKNYVFWDTVSVQISFPFPNVLLIYILKYHFCSIYFGFLLWRLHLFRRPTSPKWNARSSSYIFCPPFFTIFICTTPCIHFHRAGACGTSTQVTTPVADGVCAGVLHDVALGTPRPSAKTHCLYSSAEVPHRQVLSKY